jgi:hypothetical protein
MHEGIYMTSGSIIEIVGSSRSVGVFHSVWTCSGVFPAMRWMMIENVLGVPTLWGRLYFAAKSVVTGMDGMPCPLL